MKRQRQWILISVLALGLLLALAAGLALAQEPEPPEGTTGVEGETSAATIVPGAIPIQGQLTDDSGNPLDGTYNITFRLYDVESGGAPLCSDTNSVSVTNGLFSSYMDYCYDDLYGQKVWLGVEAESDGEMTPRQVIYPVPYAITLKPGAVISYTYDGILTVRSTGTGDKDAFFAYAGDEGEAVSAFSPNGVAVAAFSDNFLGVQAYTYDTANDHPGVFGCAADSASTCDPYRDDNGAGVMGYSQNDRGGYFVGHDGGVYGLSTDGEGVLGISTNGWGVEGASSYDDGVRGFSVAGYGVHGISLSSTGRGVYGEAMDSGGGIGVEGESQVGTGVYGNSAEGYGVYGNTGAASNNYGLFTPDNLYSANFHTMAARMQIVQNGGSKPLEPGDVVAFSGIGAPLEADGMPVIQVIEATSANSSAVAGVVSSRFNIEAVTGNPEKVNLEATPEGPVQPGEYMLVVVQGPAQVKASALAASIQPGDLLSSAGQSGHAAKAAEMAFGDVKAAIPGTVLGKALEPLDEGQAMIYVFVTLQ